MGSEDPSLVLFSNLLKSITVIKVKLFILNNYSPGSNVSLLDFTTLLVTVKNCHLAYDPTNKSDSGN
jgi:hypothetical protein